MVAPITVNGFTASASALITSHKPGTIEKHLKELDELEKRCLAIQDKVPVKCPLSGDIIMKHFKLEPGPQIGVMKDTIMNAVMEGKLSHNGDNKLYLNYLKKVQ